MSVLNKCNSMSQIREQIAAYDSECAMAVSVLERKHSRSQLVADLSDSESKSESESEIESESESNLIENENEVPVPRMYEVGQKINRFFPGYGWCLGSVTAVIGKHEELRKVVYDDGDEESLTIDALDVITSEPKYGEPGYRIMKMFRCKEGWRPFNAKVSKQLLDGKYRICWDPPDGKSEVVSEQTLRRFSMTKNNADDGNKDGSEDGSKDRSGDSREDGSEDSCNKSNDDSSDKSSDESSEDETEDQIAMAIAKKKGYHFHGTMGVNC
jgi:hypothetical protein